MSIERSRSLRKHATESEKRIWRGLRLLRREGLHFRRQPQVGAYYPDFACHRAKLIVELDGSHHDLPEQKVYDAERTRFLESVGYRVIRLRNVEANAESIADYIRSLLRPPPPTPPGFAFGYAAASEYHLARRSASGGGPSLGEGSSFARRDHVSNAHDRPHA